MSELVAFDVEASGLHPDDGALVSVLAFAYRKGGKGRVRRVAIPVGQGREHEHDDGQELWDRAVEWLSGQRLVAHNAKYDLTMMRAGSITGYAGRDLSAQFLWDTMVAQHQFDPTEPLSLKKTSARLLGADAWEEDLQAHLGPKKDPRYDLVPWPVMRPYVLADVENCLRLFELQMGRLDEGEARWDTLHREMELTRTLTRMEFRGIRYDGEGSLEVAAQLAAEMDAIKAALPDEMKVQKKGKTFGKITANSVKHYYFEHLGLKATRKTKGGDASMDERTRAALAAADAPHAREYDRLCRLTTAHNLWYDAYPRMLGKDGRLRTVYRQSSVRSGRLSSSRVNLQAVPNYNGVLEGMPSVRDFMKPRLGSNLWEVDVSQAELRIGAHVAKCSSIVDIIRTGQDLHGFVANRMFNATEDHPDWARFRQCAKWALYITLYGGGPAALVKQGGERANFIISLEDASDFIGYFRKEFPEFGNSSRDIENDVIQRGYVDLPFGLRSYFSPEDRAGRAYSGFNRTVQAGVAECMKRAMVEFDALRPNMLLLQVHDSMVIESVHEHPAKECSAIMTRVFEEAYPGTPFDMDIKPWKNTTFAKQDSHVKVQGLPSSPPQKGSTNASR